MGKAISNMLSSFWCGGRSTEIAIERKPGNYISLTLREAGKKKCLVNPFGRY